MVSGVPAVHVWYVPKGRALFRALGQEARAVSVERVLSDKGEGELLKIATDTWSNRTTLVNDFTEGVSHLRNKALSTVDVLLEFVEGQKL